jgi:hypothetical protein
VVVDPGADVPAPEAPGKAADEAGPAATTIGSAGEADGASGPLRGVRDARWQQEHLTLSDVDGLRAAIFIDDLDLDIAFQLVEQFFTFFPVVVLAAIGAADDHDDKVLIFNINLLVAYGRFQQMAVFLDPVLEVERFSDWHTRRFFSTRS